MPDSIGDIAARLAAEHGEVLTFPPALAPIPAPAYARVAGKRKPGPKQLAHIEEILLQLLNHEESGTVRIAAAKVLLDRMGAATKEEDDAKKREAEERRLALAEAENILAEFAAAKLAGVSVPSEMAGDGAPATVDAATPETRE